MFYLRGFERVPLDGPIGPRGLPSMHTVPTFSTSFLTRSVCLLHHIKRSSEIEFRGLISKSPASSTDAWIVQQVVWKVWFQGRKVSSVSGAEFRQRRTQRSLIKALKYPLELLSSSSKHSPVLHSQLNLTTVISIIINYLKFSRSTYFTHIHQHNGTNSHCHRGNGSSRKFHRCSRPPIRSLQGSSHHPQHHQCQGKGA